MNNQIEQLKIRIRAHEDCIKARKKQLLELSPFKVGDKVVVKDAFINSKPITCFVSSVELAYDLNYYYKFNKPNKAGGMSGMGAGIYGTPKSIETFYK